MRTANGFVVTALSKNPVISADFVMVSWMHNTAIDINNIGRECNHREHRGTQRIGSKTLCSLWLNPVAFTARVGSIRPQQISADLLDSCHSFIRDCEHSERSRWHKISTRDGCADAAHPRIVTNDANCTNVRTRAHHHEIDVFSLEFSIVPVVTNMLQTRHSLFP